MLRTAETGERERRKVKVKFRPRRPRGELYLYSWFNLGARWSWVISATPRPVYPRKILGTHFIGGWVGYRAGLNGCRKSHIHRDSIPGPSSLQRVSIPTELFWPSQENHIIPYLLYESVSIPKMYPE
jgi:hypothetical protein